MTDARPPDRAGAARNPAWWASGSGLGASGGNAADFAQAMTWQAGQRVTRSQIDSLHHAVELVATSGGMDTVDALTLLLNNGLAHLNLSVPPSDLTLPPNDPAAPFDPERGSSWTTWRTGEDGRPEIAFGPGDWRVVEGHRVGPTDSSPELLAGTYDRSRATRLAGLVVTSTEAVTLGPDGRFELSSRSLATGDPSSAAAAPSTVLQRSDTAAGTTTSASMSGGATAGVTVGASRSEGGDPARRGSYRLLEDGFGIEMTGDDGATRRQLLFVRDDRVFLGDRSYGRRDDAASDVSRGARHPGDDDVGPASFGSPSVGSYAAVSDGLSSSEDDRRRKRVAEALAASTGRSGEPSDESNDRDV